MIKNGQIWESPSKLLAIAQELEHDLWVLLGTPTPVIGGTEMRPVRVHNTIKVCEPPVLSHGHIFHTRMCIEEHLAAGWRLRKDLKLDWL